ncbi:hypothetical protein [Jeotgalibacillus proteolyticus]|uniref:Uncharacterized protein n=1 Tax=Jeotgalibacillus proteolyticus TaxID=2082395 RepID=A0A2S5GAY2_9BACL|nr:hypothetical protein [Jeotgalibacillus proteolyticus]PPA70053.1 hypothetical protein C4B60_10685 [Jeotgalibacillus proteolyticus]
MKKGDANVGAVADYEKNVNEVKKDQLSESILELREIGAQLRIDNPRATSPQSIKEAVKLAREMRSIT